MPAIRGLTVCVGDWYSKLLSITLPRNMRHMTECWVVTRPDDEATKAAAQSVPGVRVFETDAFTRHGARFNKGLAIQECLEGMAGDGGFCLIWDADILLPDCIPLERVRPGCLHGARRRFVDNPDHWHPEYDWSHARREPDNEFIGFFQLFDLDADCLPRGPGPTGKKRAWYEVTFAHSGGGDAYFITHFPPSRRVKLGIDVLHLGPRDTHWFGCDAESKEVMAAFVRRNNWHRAVAQFPPGAGANVGAIVERVNVPGYESTSYELPFVRRTKAMAR